MAKRGAASASKLKAAASKHVKGAKNEMPPPPPSTLLPRSAHPASTMPPRHRTSAAATSLVVHRPTSEIKVSEQHSFELVRTAMTATISAIVSIRKIFPPGKFVHRTFDWADPQVTYDAFVKGVESQYTYEESDEVVIWRVLNRNDDRAVNKLLDWIEVAATDALKKKYLKKLQLSFHSIDGNDVSDANLVEAWTMGFTYEDGEMQIGVVEGKNASIDTMVLRDAKKELHSLMWNINLMMKARAPLPVNRRMSMSFMYNNTCPDDYQPPGFHAADGQNRLIASNAGVEIGSANTGFHRVALEIYEASAQNSQSGQPTSKRRRILADPTILSEHTVSETDGNGTQEQALKLLHGMGKYRVPGTQDTQLVSSPAQSATEKHPLPLQNSPVFLPYSQTIMERIEQGRNDKAIRAEQHYPEIRGTCECGVLADQDHLIQCDICDESKHIQCYGHLDTIQANTKFACYSCLLDFEESLLSQMKVTCVLRRTLYYFHEQLGILRSIEQLALHLGRDNDYTENILGQLEHLGYVERVADYENIRKGKGKRKDIIKPLYTLIADDEMLRRTIFCPAMDIPHKLVLPSFIPPESVDLSVNGRDDLDLDSGPTTSPIAGTAFTPKLDRVQELMPLRQGALAEASSTEGTPSPRSARVRQVSRRTPEARSGLLSGGSSLRKRCLESTPEASRSTRYQSGLSEAEFDPRIIIREKFSVVNSPQPFGP